MFHAMVGFILILFSQLHMLARVLIISGKFVQVRTTPNHRSTHISNYRSSEHKSNQHDESDQMKFPCTIKNALLSQETILACPLPQKDCATLLHFRYHYRYLLFTNYLAIKLLVTTYNFSACREYLAENYLSFPSAPHLTLLLVKRTMIDHLYLWVINSLFWCRCRGVKHSW